MEGRASLTRSLLAAAIIAVVAAASAWPLYNLINVYVMHRGDIVVRIYRDSATSLTPITNASLTAIVFYPSPVNGSTVFQVVFNGSYQGTFYISPKALINWSLGWLKKYGPTAYLWLEPSIIFGVAYPVNNGSDPYVVTQMFAEPFNLSYPLEGRGAIFNLVITRPVIMQLGAAGALRNYAQYVNYTVPVKVRLEPAWPGQEGTTTTTITNTSVTETSGPYPGTVCTVASSGTTTLYSMASYFIVPRVEYWYPNSSGVAPIAIATLVASYNGSAAGGSRVSIAAYLQSQSKSGASVDVDISEVPAGSLAEALQDLGYGVSDAWSALSVDVPGPSLQINLYSSSSSLEERAGGSAFSSPQFGYSNVLQLYVMGQIAFINWTLLIERGYPPCENVEPQGFGPVLTELVVEESGNAMLPVVYYYDINDTCTDIQLWAIGQANPYADYYDGLDEVCPYPELPAPVNWTYVNYSMRYLGTALYNNGGPGWSQSYLSFTGSGSDFGVSLNVGMILGYLADVMGAPVPPQLVAVMLPVNVGLQFTNYNDVLQLEMFFAYASPGLEVYVTGSLNTSYFSYTTSSGSTVHLPVAFVYGTVLNAS